MRWRAAAWGRRVDELLAADATRRELTVRVEELRATQNQASKAIGKADGDEKQRLIAEVGTVSTELKELEPKLADAEATLTGLLASTPNLPDPSAPDGGEDDAVEIKRNHDQPPVFDFEVRDHVALGELLGVLDIERGVAHERLTVRLPAGRHRAAAVRARPQRDGHPDAGGLHPGDPAGARARGGDVRHGVPAVGRREHLPHRRGRPVPGRHGRGTARRAAHGRDHRRGAAAGALRGLFDVLPARGRQLRQGPRRDVPRAPVRQGRDVHVHRRRRRAPRRTSSS